MPDRWTLGKLGPKSSKVFRYGFCWQLSHSASPKWWHVVAFGLNGSQQCDIPPLEDGVSYTQAAAGWNHTVLLRSDGRAVACGEKKAGHCDIPVLDEGQSYAQVSAAFLHTVLPRSDGSAVACGSDDSGQCDVLPLDQGMTYSQVFCRQVSHSASPQWWLCFGQWK